MLEDWLDIAAPSVIMCGRGKGPLALTPDFLRSRVEGTALPIPVYVGHDPGEPVASVVALRVDESRYCQIQARLGDLDPAFVRECARGRLFGRSPLVRGRGIEHLAFAGMDDIPGSIGLWPTHFIDPAAFDCLDSYVAACSAADRHRAHAELVVLGAVFSHRPQDVRNPSAPGFQAIFAKTSSASPPPSPQDTWGFDRPGIAAYISEGNEALFSRGGNTVAAGSEPDDAWEPYTGGTRGGRTWSTSVPGGSGPLWKAEREPRASAVWNAPERLTISGSASNVWFDAAPLLSVDEYLWMSQRRTRGAPQVGAAVSAPFVSPRSISRVARDGADGVTTTITRTVTEPLADAAVTTAKIALGATSAVGVATARSGKSLSVSALEGGNGYKYLMQVSGSVYSDDGSTNEDYNTITCRLLRGSSAVASTTLRVFDRSSGEFALAASGNHPSTLGFGFQVSANHAGTLRLNPTSMTVFIGKR